MERTRTGSGRLREARGRVLGAAAAMAAVVLGLLPVGAASAATPLPVGAQVAAATARPDAYQSAPDVAWNGSVYLVVWSEQLAGVEASSIWATRVSAGGRVLDPGGILLSGDSQSPNSRPAVAAGNGRFLVVWEEYNSPDDIRGALLSGAGAVLKQWYVSSAEDAQSDPDVAWNGEQFLVVWVDQVDGEPYDVYGTRVRWSGRTLDGCGSDSCDELSHGIDLGSSAPGDQVEPAVTAVRTGAAAGTFLASWTDRAVPAAPVLRTARLSPSAVPLDGAGVLLSGPGGAPARSALGVRGGDVRAVWVDQRRATAPDVFGTRVAVGGGAPSPAPAGGRPVVAAPGTQAQADVTALGTGHLVVWSDDRTGGQDVRAARVALDGAVRDTGGVLVSGSAAAEGAPACATGSGSALVAYVRVVGGAVEARPRVMVRVVG